MTPPGDDRSLEDATACVAKAWKAPKQRGCIGRNYERMLRKADRLTDALAAEPQPEPAILPTPALERLRFFTVAACNFEEPENAAEAGPAGTKTSGRRPQPQRTDP